MHLYQRCMYGCKGDALLFQLIPNFIMFNNADVILISLARTLFWFLMMTFVFEFPLSLLLPSQQTLQRT